jgi:hypothetical protein
VHNQPDWQVLQQSHQAAHMVTVRVRQYHYFYVGNAMSLQIRENCGAIASDATINDNILTIWRLEPSAVALPNVEKSGNERSVRT